MAELGRVHTERRMACPHCGSLLPQGLWEELLVAEERTCSRCGGPVRLPENIRERARQSRFLGHNLDLTV